MGLSIAGGSGSGGFSLRGLHDSQQRLEHTARQLASGKRITTAADDAAGLAMAVRMLAQERSLGQGVRNLEDGNSMVQTAEASLQSTADTLGRMRELSVQAQNGTLNDTDRANIQQEYDQLSAQVTQVAQGTSFGGRNLLDGSLTGSGSVAITDGTGAPPTRIAVADQSASALGVQGRAVEDPKTLDAIDRAIDSVSQTRAGLGATSNELQSRVNQDRSAVETTSESRSRIEDADVAYTTALQTRDAISRDANVLLLAHGRSLEARSVLHLLA